MKAYEFLKKGKIEKNLFLIYGEEKYLADMSVVKIKNTFNLEPEDFNYVIVNEQVSLERLTGILMAPPCLAENKVVVIKDASVLKLSDKIQEIIENLEPYIFVVFLLSEKPDRRKKIIKMIEQKGHVIEAESPTPAELTEWIASTCKKSGCKITKKSVEFLKEVCGTEMYTLQNEINKLACISKEITDELIDTYCARDIEYDVFSLHKLMINGEVIKAVKTAEDIIENEKSPFGMLAVLSAKFRQMYMAKACLNARYSRDRAIEQMTLQGKIKPYAAKMALEEATKFTMEEIIHGIELLAEIDYNLKTGRADMNIGTDILLLKLYNKMLP